MPATPFTHAAFADPDHRCINAHTESGAMLSIPVDTNNRAYCTLLDSGIAIADYIPPALSHIDRRAADYPPLGDQLDALWKYIATLTQSGETLPQDTHRLLSQIQAVKDAHPKPETA